MEQEDMKNKKDCTITEKPLLAEVVEGGEGGAIENSECNVAEEKSDYENSQESMADVNMDGDSDSESGRLVIDTGE